MTNAFLRRDDIQRGYGNEDRPLTKVLWERDSRGQNAAMASAGNHDPARLHADFKRYYDPGFAELELQKVLLKSWLFACREEDIPNVGDRTPFKIGRIGFFVVRIAENEFKAFYNSCLHRGTELCSKTGAAETIRCPYHAWEWKLDGSLKRIPSHWDFQSLNLKTGALREVKLERWGGFIYINADPGSASLLEALGPVPEHFAGYKIEDRYTAAHFRKHVAANWKIAQEAFMESYHVVATHPEAVPYNGDSQTQYDIWAGPHGHVGRQITPSAIPSMHAPADASPLAAAQAYAMIMKSWHYPEAELPALDPAQNLRAQIGDWHRQVQEQVYDKNNDTTPDAIMIDSLLYFIFPQSTLWLSESLPFTYQFSPHPTDPEKSFFNVRMLLPVAAGQPRPPSAPVIDVLEHETIAEKAPAFGFLAIVFDQDMANMPIVQAGMKSADPARHHSLLGTYQEMIIQHWTDVMDEMIAS
jgi:phenylpropionate dioxygenase-like ring-hydroxylating dioxygenase large terminal subunit